MPGRILVSVLEAVGLPEEDTGLSEFVAVKVSLGDQQFVTAHEKLHNGKTDSWNSNFAFRVLNLTDKLVVAVCDEAGEVKSRTAIEVKPILEAGFREEPVALEKGGQIHLKLSFVLTNEERKRLNFMRAATNNREFCKRRDDMLRLYDLRRKEEVCVTNGLRTIAESKREHIGQDLDNLEIFTKKKEREVSSSQLFALPLPQPAESLKPKLKPLSAGKSNEVEHPTDIQNCGNSSKQPSGNDFGPRQAQHVHVVCHSPEMEECMAVPGRFQDPLRRNSDSMNPPLHILSPKSMDVIDIKTHSFHGDKTTSQGSTFKENMGSDQEPSHGCKASVLEPLPAAKKVERSSVKRTPNANIGISAPLPRGKEEAKVLPRVREGKPKSLNSNMKESGRYHHQQEHSLEPSTCQEQVVGVSGLSNTWVGVETISSLLSNHLEDCCTSVDKESKLLSPPQTPMDGWICVERPPMTWEDALKVAQQARETKTVGGAAYLSLPRPSPAILTSLPVPVTPASSQSSGKDSQMLHPGKGAVLSPLPLPPKQSLSGGRISQGNVKARINALESSQHQGLDRPICKLENGKMQLELAVEIQDKRRGEEKLKKLEGRVGNKGQSAQDCPSQSSEGRQTTNPKQGRPSRVDLPKGGMGDVDQKSRLPDGSHAYRLHAPPTAEVRLDSEVATGKLTTEENTRVTPPNVWRLPVLEEINVEAMQDEMTQDSATEEEFVSAGEGRLLQKESSGKFFQDQVNFKVGKERAAIAQFEGMEEKKVVAEGPVMDKTVQTTRDLAFLFPSESHSEDCIKSRHPQNPTTDPLPEPLTLQQLALSADSLQAWKCTQNSMSTARKSFLISSTLTEEFQQISASSKMVRANGMVDEPFAAAALQAAGVVKENLGTLVDHLQFPPVRVVHSEKAFHESGGAPSKTSDTNILSHLGGVVKQALGGAVILVGLIAIWPRNLGTVERYHVVKAGETLSSIAPGQCNDPSSTFCKINPRICDQKFIYPGQRLRLS